MSRLAIALCLVAGLAFVPLSASGYPGGTPNFVTDVAPFCAVCHASVSEAQLEGVPEARVRAEQAEQKHIQKIRAAKEGTPYAALGDAERQALIEGIRAIDQNASVQVLAPPRVQAGQEFEVIVEARGGGGPVVGLALVDAAHRWQARPAPSAGFEVVASPAVIGPDGAPQDRFTSKRQGAPGVSYVNVYGVEADPVAGTYASVKVTWRLRAPARAGRYPLAAAFLYGTEKGSPHGAVDAPWGGKAPLGTSGGNAGRVRFSDVISVEVE